jgi:tetratricopeptide (TPR) repeat protein
VKFLIYAAALLAVLIAFVIVLRSIDDGHRPVFREVAKTPVVESAPPVDSSVDLDSYADSPSGDLYAAGAELFDLWHVREATTLLERAVAADSSLYDAWVRLVECYSHPLVGREDDALAALAMATEARTSDGDSVFLAGLEQLVVVRDYVAAAAVLDRATSSGAGGNRAVYYYALALLLSGRVEEASGQVQELAGGDDSGGRLAELNIRCAVAAGELGVAGERARALARSYPEEPYPYVILSLVEQMAGRPESAVEFSSNALVLDSKYIPAILARANLYAAAGEFEAARVSFEKLLLFDDSLLRALGYEGIGFVDLLSGRFNSGVSELEEAIHSAMLAGAVRRGLALATQLVAYLCELGRPEAAAAVVDRWVTGFGDVPVALASMRIDILEGDLEAASYVLQQIQSSKDWSEWAGMMSIDGTEMAALVHIGAGEYDAALGILSSSPNSVSVQQVSRMFLKGYASFDNGMAEAASEAFAAVGQLLFGVEFPYHGDAVQYVRSVFYLGETRIASGNEEAAAEYYERFLGYWGDADWDLQAVARARQKLESLSYSHSQ